MRRAVLVAALLIASAPAFAQISGYFGGAQGGAVQIGESTTTCNGAAEGAIRYNSADKNPEFCDGTAWTPFAQIQQTPGPTAPAGSGYLVLTETTWTGDLGGLSGADDKCYTELTSTYTSWRGHDDADANGQLTTGKVKAFLCDMSTCNNLMPLTTYYFAYANSATPGGASFTTNSTGLGPGDSNAWSAANYFSGTYTYWTGREDDPGGGVTPTMWTNANVAQSDYSCWSWTDNTSGSNAILGNSSYTDAQRWWTSRPACNNTHRLICFVNP